MKLKFGKGNAKLDKTIYTFSLPAGRTCPGANECKSLAVEKNGRRTIQDGPETKFRCFAASQEVLYTTTYNARKHNLDALKEAKTKDNMANLISRSLPKKATTVRIHVSGDFYSQRYFDAWLEVARRHSAITFYAYTKSLAFWVKRQGDIPSNFILTASCGGKFDDLIDKAKLRYARVVFSEEEAARLGLPIDKDDSHAMKARGNFALLLHGVQPKGSRAASALVKLKKAGKGGYAKS